MDLPALVATLDDLLALYRPPSDRVAAKSRAVIDDASARFIDRCPFVVLSTAGADGSVDASPRGGPPGFLQRLDDRHVAIADLNGNNRLDSLRNIVANPWAGLLLMIPGHDETLRINGPAGLTTDAGILAGFTAELRVPKLAAVVETAEVFAHCAKAFRRSGLWNPATWAALADAPDLAEIFSCQHGDDPDALRSMLAESYAEDLAAD
jgi:PPOX class probable FMN-dependent enzyme